MAEMSSQRPVSPTSSIASPSSTNSDFESSICDSDLEQSSFEGDISPSQSPASSISSEFDSMVIDTDIEPSYDLDKQRSLTENISTSQQRPVVSFSTASSSEFDASSVTNSPIVDTYLEPNFAAINKRTEIIQRPISSTSNISSTSSSSATNNIEFESNSTSLCNNYLEQSYVLLKILCLEQIKKPGKDYYELFQLINDSQLTLRIRQFLVRELIYEASRFKKTDLIQKLNKFYYLINEIGENKSNSPNDEINV